MRWILATLLVLVGCATPTYRGPLVTDATPLGMSAPDVIAWHRDHGWCRAANRGEYLVYRLCDDRRVEVRLRFQRFRLAEAVVVSYVPAAREAVGRGDLSRPTTTRRDGIAPRRERTPFRREQPRDLTHDVLEALAVELHVRYGRPIHVSDGRRIWRRPYEDVVLMPAATERAVLERHVARTPDWPR